MSKINHNLITNDSDTPFAYRAVFVDTEKKVALCTNGFIAGAWSLGEQITGTISFAVEAKNKIVDLIARLRGGESAISINVDLNRLQTLIRAFDADKEAHAHATLCVRRIKDGHILEIVAEDGATAYLMPIVKSGDFPSIADALVAVNKTEPEVQA